MSAPDEREERFDADCLAADGYVRVETLREGAVLEVNLLQKADEYVVYLCEETVQERWAVVFYAVAFEFGDSLDDAGVSGGLDC